MRAEGRAVERRARLLSARHALHAEHAPGGRDVHRVREPRGRAWARARQRGERREHKGARPHTGLKSGADFALASRERRGTSTTPSLRRAASQAAPDCAEGAFRLGLISGRSIQKARARLGRFPGFQTEGFGKTRALPREAKKSNRQNEWCESENISCSREKRLGEEPRRHTLRRRRARCRRPRSRPRTRTRRASRRDPAPASGDRARSPRKIS